MKVVILAGGYGTRISEESHLKPKPMIEIHDRPMLWHIMKIYSHYGFNDFVICCGYKGYVIKEYFANYFLHASDITFDFSDNNKMILHNNVAEPWKVTLVDTGIDTMTGGRIKRIKNYIDKDESFFVTYGDGLSDVNIQSLLDFHILHKKTVTVTAIQPKGRFGVMQINDRNVIECFKEKPQDDNMWISGGFFVFNYDVFNYIDNDQSFLEMEPFRLLSENKEMVAYQHTGFWQPMDTLRDKYYLDQLWLKGNPPWKVWE